MCLKVCQKIIIKIRYFRSYCLAIVGNKIKNNITPASILLTIHTCIDFYPIEALHHRTLGESKKFSRKGKK